jgi:hypothetical protein
LGAITTKNVPILYDHVLRRGGMTACKHANGRDYWLIVGGSGINTYYEFLITPDSILGPYTQSIGPSYIVSQDIAYSKFSMDGSRFATGAGEGPILVMDFDRCSGIFSNPTTIYNDGCDSPAQCSGCSSLEFSPSGRFLYVADVSLLNQYDLLSGNIQDSSKLYPKDSGDFYGMDLIQMAPNGKLYASTWNGGLHAMHVINYPDFKGDSADFAYGGQPTWSNNSFNVPNLINYNLGALTGSGCDTIPTGVTQLTISNLLRVLPNPADKYIYVEMGMQGNYEFDLLNGTGQFLVKKETRQVGIFDTEGIASGIYFIRAIDKTTDNEIAAKKLVVVH